MQICYIKYNNITEHIVNGAYTEVKKLDKSKQKQILVLLNASLGCMMFTSPLFAKSLDLSIRTLGEKLVDGVQFLGFYVALSMCLFEIIKAFLESDPKRIPSIVAKFAIGVGSLYAVPLILEAVRDSF